MCFNTLDIQVELLETYLREMWFQDYIKEEPFSCKNSWIKLLHLYNKLRLLFLHLKREQGFQCIAKAEEIKIYSL